MRQLLLVGNFRQHFWLSLLSYSYIFDLCKVCKKRFSYNKIMLSVITNKTFMKLNSFHQKLYLLRLKNIFKLEILKFIYNYQNKFLPKCFSDFLLCLRNYSHPTRFESSDNYSVIRLNKTISQRSIRQLEPKLWNEPSSVTKNLARNNKTGAFIKNFKEFLHF